jgi:hypothetical protein
VSWLSPLVSGDADCVWAPWLRSRHTGYKVEAADGEWAEWRAEHAPFLHALADERRSLGERTFLEGQDKFRLRVVEGAVIDGKPDLVSAGAGEVPTVFDAKTGQPRDHHVAQVKLYMLLLPAAHPAYKGRTMAGCVAYKDGRRVQITPEEITPEFRARVRCFVDQIIAATPPSKVPSAFECRSCDISASVCPERQEWDTELSEGDIPF